MAPSAVPFPPLLLYFLSNGNDECRSLPPPSTRPSMPPLGVLPCSSQPFGTSDFPWTPFQHPSSFQPRSSSFLIGYGNTC
eukprot:3365488-Prymnesium_polylepis.1